jgi:hypothetical protein
MRGPDFRVVPAPSRLVYVTVLYADDYFEEETDVYTLLLRCFKTLASLRYVEDIVLLASFGPLE